MDRDDVRPDDALDRLWDELIIGGPPTGPAPADDDTTGLIGRLGALGDPPGSDQARERVWRNLQRHSGLKEPTRDARTIAVSAAAVPSPVTSPNGRVQQMPSPSPARGWGRAGRWALAQAATAAMLVLTVAGVLLTFVANDWSLRPGEPGADDDWPMLRGNAARTGAGEGPGPDDAPTVRWTFAPETPFHPTLVVAGETVYVGGDNTHLYALDAETGAERWRFTPGTAVNGVPAVAGATVYVGTGDGTLYALDTSDGTVRWRFAASGAICCSPAVVDGTVFIGSDGGDFYALDAATGDERWVVTVDGVSWSSPAVADGTVYVGTDNKLLYALDTATGAERWQAKLLGTSVVPVVAVADGAVYAATWNGALFALDAATGAERWRFVADQTLYSPAVASGLVYAGSDDGNLYAIDAATGQERWRVATGDRVDTLPVVAGDTVYVAGRDGYLIALDVATGAVQWRSPVAPVDFGPAVAGGLVYVVDEAGRVYALAAAGGPSPTGTPDGSGVCDCSEKGSWLR